MTKGNQEKTPAFSHSLRAFSHCKFPESKSQRVCGCLVSVQVSSKGKFKRIRGRLIGIRLCIICAVLNRNQCHGSARSSNLSDKNETQSVGRYQLWHSQPYWKFFCDDLQYPLLWGSTVKICCQSESIMPDRWLMSTKETPLALKIIFAGVPLVLYWAETKTTQLYNKITVNMQRKDSPTLSCISIYFVEGYVSLCY